MAHYRFQCEDPATKELVQNAAGRITSVRFFDDGTENWAAETTFALYRNEELLLLDGKPFRTVTIPTGLIKSEREAILVRAKNLVKNRGYLAPGITLENPEDL